MPHRCPSWLGLLLLNPLRRLVENPEKMFRGLIEEGMIVLEPGPGMGYFTLPIARMVGPGGKVIAVDIQQEMLSGVKHRAEKAGLIDRIELRTVAESGMGLGDLEGMVDFALAIHMVHEVEDQLSFFKEIRDALKDTGRLFIMEPRFHVSKRDMEQSISLATGVGFKPVEQRGKARGRTILLVKA
jgi:ubiquinone/menaquinone biosynthesis C-methylase UbiE